MKCPNCGHPLSDRSNKCLRCGYEVKALIYDEKANKENENKQEKSSDEEFIETKNVDAKNVRMGRSGGGSLFDDLFGGLFGGFGNIFGGLFGGDDDYEEDGYDDEPKYFDDFGNPMPFDVFDRDFVEIDKIEVLDAEEVSSDNEESCENQENEETQKPDGKIKSKAKDIYKKIKNKLTSNKDDNSDTKK